MESSTYFKHPLALVDSDHIGRGTRIWAFAHVLPEACIGEDCNICECVFIESRVRVGNQVTVKNGVSIWDGVILEDRVFVGPNAVFTNDRNPRAGCRKSTDQFLPTLVREGASIGANATIVCGVEIGRHAFIGAGAVVTRSVPEHAIVVGNPARRVGYMCECGAKVQPRLSCDCGRVYAMVHDRLVSLPKIASSFSDASVAAAVHPSLGTDPALL